MASVPSATLVSGDILPIFTVTERENEEWPYSPVAYHGTAFLIGPGLLVTCWHCVSADPAPGTVYAVLLQRPDSHSFRHIRIEGLEQDRNGADLATARVQLNQGPARFTLAEHPAGRGTAVWTAGYPLITPERNDSGDTGFLIPFRYLQGYIVRPFHYWHPRETASVLTYEIDMSSPRGLSGAPIIQYGTRSVLGVVYGRNDVEQVEEFASLDPRTGERTPELVRIVSFALAHHTETLWALRTNATNDRPLKEYLGHSA